MSDTEEVAAAASAGASAAVQAVQEQQELEDAAKRAELAAEISADTAAEASVTASEAVSAASTAGSIAVDASEQAETATAIAAATAADIERLDTRITDMDTRHSAFVTEARDFFARLESRENDNGVQEVEVTTHAPSADSAATETGGQANSGGNGGTSVVPSRRHRFGGKRTS